MRIATWNINGLRSGLQYLKDFLVEYDIDVLALQEIKIHESSLTEEIKRIDGYYSFFNPADKKGYSGTAFYSRELPRSVSIGLGDPIIDSEGRVIEIEMGGCKIINFYFPHSSRDLHRLDFKSTFNKKARKFLQNKIGKALIVCGDFNVAHQDIDLARPKQNRNNAGFTAIEKKEFDQLLKIGLIDVYRKRFPSRQEFTWWGHFYNMRARNIGWRIDYFLATPEIYDQIKKIQIAQPVMGSDHCPVIIELKQQL